MAWLEVSVAVAREHAQAATATLQSLGAEAVTASAAGEEELLEPAPGEQPLWNQLRLQALFRADVDLRALRRRLAAAEARLVDVDFVAPEDWQARSRAHAVRACFGGRLWLLPRDEPFDPPDRCAAAVLRLDPGLAFGSGSHPTTRLCLAGLADAELTGARVLDYGCGSGVLAIAACLLGARTVVAVDHDPQALVATRDNAVYNSVPADRLEVLAPEAVAVPPDPDGGFDLAVANILANPLIGMAARLTALVRPGGRMLLSGILEGQQSAVVEAYPEVEFAEPAREAEWLRLDGFRRHRPAVTL